MNGYMLYEKLDNIVREALGYSFEAYDIYRSINTKYLTVRSGCCYIGTLSTGEGKFRYFPKDTNNVMDSITGEIVDDFLESIKDYQKIWSLKSSDIFDYGSCLSLEKGRSPRLSDNDLFYNYAIVVCVKGGSIEAVHTDSSMYRHINFSIRNSSYKFRFCKRCANVLLKNTFSSEFVKKENSIREVRVLNIDKYNSIEFKLTLCDENTVKLLVSNYRKAVKVNS